MIVPVLAPNIVGPQWTSIGSRLSREFGWKLKRMPKMLLGQAPRRFGKTISLGGIMLNYALEVPGCIQSAFSTSKRASQKLKSKVQQIFIESGLESWIFRSGEEQLYLRDPENTSDIIRQMNFYPSNKVIDRESDRYVILLSFIRVSVSPFFPVLSVFSVSMQVGRRSHPSHTPFKYHFYTSIEIDVWMCCLKTVYSALSYGFCESSSFPFSWTGQFSAPDLG